MAIITKVHNKTIHVGDTISVHYRIIEKDVVSGKTKKEKHEEQKERIQEFVGIVIAIRGGGENQSFIVRRIGAGGIGIERIFPVVSPWIKNVVIKKKGDVRRAKLYYLREKTAKEIARLSSETVAEIEVEPQLEQAKDEPATKEITPPSPESAVPANANQQSA